MTEGSQPPGVGHALLRVGLPFIAADVGLAAATGFRVPASLVVLSMVVGLGLVCSAILTARLAARALGRPHAPVAGVTLLGLHGLLGALFLARFGLDRAALTSGSGLAMLALLGALVALPSLWLLRRPARKDGGMVTPLGLAAAHLGLLMAPGLLRDAGLPLAHAPLVVVALAAALATVFHRHLHSGRAAGLTLGVVCVVAPFVMRSWTWDPRPRLPAPHSTSTAQANAPNLLLISIDTLRADAVGPRADGTTHTPRLDALAAAGRRLDATSPAGWTLPSHATMLTGMDPPGHGVLLDTHRIADDVPTVAQRLKKAGYRTAALTAGGYMSPRFGHARGFDVFDERSAYRYYFVHHPAASYLLTPIPWRWVQDLLSVDGPFEDVTRRVNEWLEDEPNDAPPWFLFLHTFEVHNYRRIYPWLDPLLEERGIDASRRAELRRIGLDNLGDWPDDAFTDYRTVYEAGLTWVDGQVGDLLDALDQRSLTDHTAVLIVSDHGEGFDVARNRLGHGGRLHDDLVQVPVVARLPRDQTFASPPDAPGLVDVTPTLLHLAGLPTDSLDGTSWVAPQDGSTARVPRGWVFGQEAYLRGARRQAGNARLTDPEEWQVSLRTATRKAIHSTRGWELYDLLRDPDERQDLIQEGAQPDAETQQHLLDFLERSRAVGRGGSVEHSLVDEALLRELGYVKSP